ncbi:MAG: ComEC/Rec2 family competence protein [Bdellovibrionales bacterium]|nr:ComEC/Rec2 family competence protein [Bdellovibrionales bacterium]
MIFLLLLLWFGPFFSPILDVGRALNTLSDPMHYWCLKQMPQESTYLNLYSALLCGKELPVGTYRSAFQSIGLYHVLVVSGSHLLAIQKLLEPICHKFIFSQILINIILFIYCLLCDANPPVIRAFVYCLITQLAFVRKWYWNSAQTTLFSGIVTLIFFPQWIRSLSFNLSWIAALAVQWAHHLTQSKLKTAILTNGFMVPALVGWTVIHPFGWIANWLIAPLMGEGLLLLSFLGCLNSWFTYLCDKVWGGLFFLLNQWSQMIPSQPSSPAKANLIVFYLWFLQSIWLFFLWHKKKRKSFIQH